MGTTTLLVLRGRLQTAIGDKNQVYADSYTDAINNAIREIYPNLHKRLEDKTLVTGNMLPDNSFERWSSTSALTFYSSTSSSATFAQSTSAGLYRGARATKAMKFTAAAADDYIKISSNDYPRLLDLMGRTINFKCWVYPESAKDAWIQIYTIKADGTEQELPSTHPNTGCPATKWTLLELESQAINDDIVEIQFRLRVHTSGKYVIFDSGRQTGRNLYEYLLPEDFAEGTVSQVYVQATGYSDDICDDLQPRAWERVYGFEVIDDGTYKYLRLPLLHTSNRQIRLIGYCPLETLTTDTSTISLDDEKQLNLLITYAAYWLFTMEEGVPASGDTSRVENKADRWLRKYYRLLPHARMTVPTITMKLPVW